MGEIWDDFGLGNDTHKASKNDKTKKKTMLKTSPFFASLVLTFGVILGPKTGFPRQPDFCQKSPFLSILLQLSVWSVLDSIWDAKEAPEWIKHLISDDLSASSKSFLFSKRPRMTLFISMGCLKRHFDF